jgi:peptide/nickel transport system permease protein
MMQRRRMRRQPPLIMYLVRRILAAATTLVVLSIITFGLFFAVPADPAALQCGDQCTKEQVELVRHGLDLDRPVPQLYLEFMAGIFVGRTIGFGEQKQENNCSAPCLGYSFRTFEPVTDMIGRALPITASIVFGALMLWLSAGVSMGVIAALRRGTWIDKTVIALSVTAASAQVLFVALVLQVVVVYQLGWLPVPSYTSPSENLGRWLTGLLLPWVALAMGISASYARLTRAQLVETLAEEFTLASRAKGLRERRVVRQALRAAITPIVTIAGLDVGALLGGVVVIETIFGLPGLGQTALKATQELNLPVVMATVLLGGLFVVVMNLIADLLYAFVDPRVRLT